MKKYLPTVFFLLSVQPLWTLEIDTLCPAEPLEGGEEGWAQSQVRTGEELSDRIWTLFIHSFIHSLNKYSNFFKFVYFWLC